VAGAASLAYAYSEAGVVRNGVRTFEAGGVSPEWNAADDEKTLIPRPRLLEDLQRLLQAQHGRYAVVVGSAGTGKSTALRQTVRACSGALYLDTPTLLSSFSISLAAVVGFYRPVGWVDSVVRLFSGESKEVCLPPASDEPQATFQLLEPYLFAAAAAYKAKHKRPALLVLDGMDVVAKEDQAFFLKIQDFAKKSADKRTLRVVLVFSDGHALPLLRSSSAFSRAAQVFEVGDADVNDEAAADWLVSQHGMEQHRARAMVEMIAGGRFATLLLCACAHSSPSELRSELDSVTEADLKRLRISPRAPLFRALLASTQLRDSQALDLASDAQLQELLRLNILRAHPGRGYSLHDRHVERFIAARQRAGGFFGWWVS
jgi:hypothetical protein